MRYENLKDLDPGFADYWMDHAEDWHWDADDVNEGTYECPGLTADMVPLEWRHLVPKLGFSGLDEGFEWDTREERRNRSTSNSSKFSTSGSTLLLIYFITVPIECFQNRIRRA